jgi:hypothetical protein
MNYEDMSKEELISLLYRRDNLIKQLQLSTKEIVLISEDFRKQMDIKEELIQELLQSVRLSNIELLSKNDIQDLFKCESDKALRILKWLYANGFGCKIGKEYHITKNEFSKFITSINGKDLKI